MGDPLVLVPPPLIPPRHAWKPGAPDPPGRDDTKTRDEDEAREDEPRLFRCRTCGTPVADPADVFTAGSDAVDVYLNPAGFAHEIVTLRRARNVVPVGTPTTDFTWFAGYAWSHLACLGCASHLGWYYTGGPDRSPPAFFGLRRSEVIEPDGR